MTKIYYDSKQIMFCFSLLILRIFLSILTYSSIKYINDHISLSSIMLQNSFICNSSIRYKRSLKETFSVYKFFFEAINCYFFRKLYFASIKRSVDFETWKFLQHFNNISFILEYLICDCREVASSKR